VASIDRTAYPRFKRSISVRELREAYSPSLDELEWARQMTDSDEALLSLTMCLKCCQRLGYFARFDEVPASIVGHLRQELGLHESVNPATVPDKTVRNHRGLVRHRLGLVSDQAAARKIAAEAIRTAAETKDNPADLINIALEELVKSNCELPGYTTLDRMAGQIRAEVNTRMHELVHGRMTGDERRRILALLRVDPLSRRSGHDQLKDVAPKATVSRLRRHLDHLAWLDGIGSATATWLKDIPAAKTGHFAGEAGALDASEMGDFAVVKRIVLEVCLLHRARVHARDDLVTMLCKRMNTLHNKAGELLEEIRAGQRERNERMLAVFGEVLKAARAIDVDGQSAARPWSPVRRRYGASSRSITCDRSSMPAVSRSMRASTLASSAACSSVKNSAPSTASSSRLILRRAAARASWASTLGLRSPAIRWSMMSRPVTPCRSVITLEILIAADSSSFSARCFSRVRSSVRSRR